MGFVGECFNRCCAENEKNRKVGSLTVLICLSLLSFISKPCIMAYDTEWQMTMVLRTS